MHKKRRMILISLQVYTFMNILYFGAFIPGQFGSSAGEVTSSFSQVGSSSSDGGYSYHGYSVGDSIDIIDHSTEDAAALLNEHQAHVND